MSLYGIAHYLNFPVALTPQVVLNFLALALLHVLGLGSLDGDYLRALQGRLLREQPRIGLLDLLPHHKDINSRQQSPIGLIGDLLTINLQNPI